MNISTKLILALTILVMLPACQRNLSSNTYTSSSTAGLVLEGTIVSVRAVTINENDKLEKNGMGMLGGGLAGGVAGSALGKGTGNAATTVGGALAGAVIGSMIQNELGKDEGFEYIIRVNKDNLTSDSKTKKKVETRLSGAKVADKITAETETSTKTELISVVQGKDVVLQAGQKVFIIYSDDRPRVVPAS